MILASVQQASDAAPMTWGVFLTMLGAVALLIVTVAGLTAWLGWLVARVEDQAIVRVPDDEMPPDPTTACGGGLTTQVRLVPMRGSER